MNNFQHLDSLKEKLDSFRPLSLQVLQNLFENTVLQWTFNSNAIEGNTLTLQETKVALEGITVGGKTLREHFEAINHKEAILFVRDLSESQSVITEWNIKALHQLILQNIDKDFAGRYRTTNVLVAGALHRPPDALILSERMKEFVDWCQNEALTLHPIERAARVHCDFVKIHPFVDGNGRTSRLLMNLELMKSGFPASVLPVSKRLEYYRSLDLAHCQGDYRSFISLISDTVQESFEPYWWALGAK